MGATRDSLARPSPYTLLVAVGQSPQVVTEAAWSLAFQHAPPLMPERVEAIGTGTGEAFTKALLLGEDRTDERGRPIDSAADRWTPFCQDVLGITTPIPLRFNVACFDGRPLYDVETPAHDALFADLCYETVRRVTSDGSPPVFGVISGGRKTMSAHLMTAFSVYARPCDHLVHVMLSPPRYERDRSFYYPTEETAELVTVHRVHPRFPRLRRLLAEGPLRGTEGGGLAGILEALEPYADVETAPDRCEVTLGDRSAEVRVLIGDVVLGTADLSPARAATFCVLADAITAGKGEADAATLYTDGPAAGSHSVHRKREWVSGWIGGGPLKPWTTNEDVSKAVHEVTAALERAPVVGRYLAIKRRPSPEALLYGWPEPLHAPIHVTAPFSLKDWPFAVLPRPTGT